MKVSGKMTSNMEKEWRHGMKGLSMRVTMLMGRRKDMDTTSGQISQYTRVNGLTIGLMALELIYGLMEGNTMVNGRIMTWRVSESTSGRMAVVMKASTTTTKSADTVSTIGQMVASTKVGGTKANSMAWVPT